MTVLCASMTLTAQEAGALFWCHVAMSLQFTHVGSFACRGRFPKLAIGKFYCWALLRNNYMAANLERFTLSYGSRRFAACVC